MENVFPPNLTIHCIDLDPIAYHENYLILKKMNNVSHTFEILPSRIFLEGYEVALLDHTKLEFPESIPCLFQLHNASQYLQWSWPKLDEEKQTDIRTNLYKKME